jgi:RNA polymerase sigma factor (sigma-70 family)
MTPTFRFETITPSVEWQQRSLLEFHRAPTSTARDAAITAIVGAFSTYVGVISRSWWRRFGRIRGGDGLQDVESAGRQALLIAIRKWRPSFEKPFIHFAAKWISESCKTEVARLQQGSVTVPLRVRLLCREYRLVAQDGGLRDEFLERLHLRDSTKTAVRFLAQSSPCPFVSVDLGETDGEPPFQLSSDQRPVPETAEISEQLAAVRQVLFTRCTPRQRLIFQCLFPEVSLTAADIGEINGRDNAPIDVARIIASSETSPVAIARLLGISRERVRQLQNETILKIRSVLRGRGLVTNGTGRRVGCRRCQRG